MTDKNLSYVLLTAAYNEEQHISRVIESVVSQTIPPVLWVIVSDGSTDRTDEIVKSLAEPHGFIRFIRRKKTGGHGFASKGLALQTGFAALGETDFAYFCTLDADVSFGKDYFETILRKFNENPGLGIAGGIIIENGRRRIASMSSVAGAVQFIRRECLEPGFRPAITEKGGEDSIIEIKAKKNGWEVQTFPELLVCHHRPTGSAGSVLLKAKFDYGDTDYRLGNPMLFEFLKCCGRVFEPPAVLAAAAIFTGYFAACCRKPAKLLSAEECRFVKKMQGAKFTEALKRFLPFGSGMKVPR